MEHRFRAGRGEVVLTRSDVTAQQTEAIANAANSLLLGGGGVDGAIHRAAGPGLLDACRAVKKTLPGGVLPTGQAVLTPGFDLKAKHVVHCVGPIFAREGADAARLLAACYENALRICQEHRIASIAFPSISTGVYGYPVQEAAPIALAAVRQHLERNDEPALVKFALFDEATLAAYVRAAQTELCSRER
jgi:O-acetyl-ADP-ribose deacetylase (regulator of RNase III)